MSSILFVKFVSVSVIDDVGVSRRREHMQHLFQLMQRLSPGCALWPPTWMFYSLVYAAMHVPIHRPKAEERLLSLSMSLLGRQRMLEKTDGLKLGSDPRDLCHLPNAYPALTYNPIDPVGCIKPMLKQRICV